LIVWQATPISMTYHGTPGQIARIIENGAYVICGDAKPLLLEIVELDGQKGPASKLIKSIKTRLSNYPQNL
jgi:hypothetical protein